MTRQMQARQRLSSEAAMFAMVGGGLALGVAERAVGQMISLLFSLAWMGLAALPTAILNEGHGLPVCTLAYQVLTEGLFRVLVSAGPIILAIASAAW